MERANEESSPASRPQLFASPRSTSFIPASNTLVSAAPPNDVNVGNGTVLSRSHSVSSRDRSVSGVIPPYWHHTRNSSRTSQISLDRPPPITLEDHTEDPNSETSRGLWAKSVTIDDHVVVQGKTGVGAYVVWNCRIQTLDVRRRRSHPRLRTRSNYLLGWPNDGSHEVCRYSRQQTYRLPRLHT